MLLFHSPPFFSHHLPSFIPDVATLLAWVHIFWRIWIETRDQEGLGPGWVCGLFLGTQHVSPLFVVHTLHTNCCELVVRENGAAVADGFALAVIDLQRRREEERTQEWDCERLVRLDKGMRCGTQCDMTRHDTTQPTTTRHDTLTKRNNNGRKAVTRYDRNNVPQPT